MHTTVKISQQIKDSLNAAAKIKNLNLTEMVELMISDYCEVRLDALGENDITPKGIMFTVVESQAKRRWMPNEKK